MTGYTYFGLMDDSVARYPWKFKLSEARLNHSLAAQVIHGKPILLNDGYLVQHSLGQKAVTQREGLLWELLASDLDFVQVLSRGGARFGLHKMPEAMAPMVESYKSLINDEFEGQVGWKELQPKLKVVHNLLERRNSYLGWPEKDLGAGFGQLAESLLTQKASGRSLGLGYTSTKLVHDFLNRFVDRMQSNTGGARSYWERLAKRFADEYSAITNEQQFVLSMMRLANEMYHYNIGILLADGYGVPISVETQTSAAFDDLLIKETIFVNEIPSLPRLNVPRVVSTAPPHKILQILDLDRSVGQARQNWLRLWSSVERDGSGSWVNQIELQGATEWYAKELSQHLGQHISYSRSEGLLSFVASTASSDVRSGLTGMVGGLAAGTIAGDAFGGLAGFATGFIISRLQKRAYASVHKKFRVAMFENQVLPPELVENSRRLVEKIKGRQLPSSVELDFEVASQIAARVPNFEVKK